MVKLLIADRDSKEREGLKWLVQAYPIPFGQVHLAGNPDELIRLLEREAPEVLCIELDMIPRSQWEQFKKHAVHFVQRVIGMTAEATFERAMQAIELHAVDLWVKPVSPDRMKRRLTHVYKQMAENRSSFQGSHPPVLAPVSYQTLFLEQKSLNENRSLLLIQPEQAKFVPVLHQFLEEYPFHHRPDLFPLSDAVVCVFPRIYPDDHTFFQQEGHRLLSVWSEHHEVPLALVVCVTDSQQSLHQKYRSAKKALEMRFFRGHQQVIFVGEQVDWLQIDPFLSTEEQREWLQMLSRYDKEGIKAWMHRHFSYRNPPFPEPGLLRIRLTSILAQLRRYMQSHLLDEDPDMEAHYHRVFASILYSPVLFRIVQDMLLFAYDLLVAAEERSLRGNFNIIEQAVQYMETHFYRHDLSLAEVAEYVGRNPSYLSHVLTSQKGTSFREILTGIRLRHACRFLRETPLTVQEIADQTGFKNPNYFSRVFKEHIGCTPRAYRDQKNERKTK
ncbi:helix-turn-helix domain-containing protein [Lihuaxuella thermophila]|uniref:Two-component response regulator, YesN/AraC family, consists of REC and AraC-type DNA-binding domains n=1 Tax=Lihuaxuella thermophila TaxID=1173111 RepID=A0A1H8JJQ3_9BACL|nr:helix-turn-helix domain-containing protein [Lihuaxuella thermophila]SEN80781.1 Two-component response regulator, YesN/AraC family, consists of REC and AraC-type DNA-binding domains [Lihuaxuella thermophila]